MTTKYISLEAAIEALCKDCRAEKSIVGAIAETLALALSFQMGG